MYANKGRLAEKKTGEGKTLDTILIAIVCALLGEQVDVVTSSEYLAERDAEKAVSLCEIFEIKVDNNCDEKAQRSDEVRKKRYQEAQIVFGVAGMFQKDHLMRYLGKNIREHTGSRLILDEADSMLIDELTKVLYISHNIEDLSYLREIFILIWRITESKGAEVATKETINEIVILVNNEIDKEEDRTINIPSDLKDYVKRNLKTWVKNAYRAKALKNGQYYSYMPAPDGSTRSVIMDVGTGVEQWNSQWSNGLQQFIQLKHLGHIPDESLQAIFISNKSFFDLYGPRKIGLTGTIGGPDEMYLMNQIFGFDFFKVPRFQHRDHEKEEDIVLASEEAYYNEIIANINRQMKPKGKISEEDKAKAAKLIVKKEEKITLLEVSLDALNDLEQATKKEICALQIEREAIALAKDASKPSDEEMSIVDRHDKNEKERADREKELLNVQKQITEEKRKLEQLKLKVMNAKHILEGNAQRAVIIICEYKKSVEELKKILEDRPELSKNRIIVCDGLETKNRLSAVLEPGDILIATNIAGRGTDIKLLDEVKKQGGAHLILAFEPPNSRIKKQNRGRIARDGEPGSSCSIVLDSLRRSHVTIGTLSEERNKKERLRLNKILKQELARLKMEQELFDCFATLLEGNVGKQGIREKLAEQKKPEKYIELQIKSLTDRWAFWFARQSRLLKRVTDDTVKAAILNDFEKFEKEIYDDLNTPTFGLVKKSVGELLKLAAFYILEEKYDEARKCYDEIINYAPHLADFAYYYRVRCHFAKSSDDEGVKQAARKDLKEAIRLMQERMSSLQASVSVMSAFEEEKTNDSEGSMPNYFAQSLTNEMSILRAHIEAAKKLLGYTLTSKDLSNDKTLSEEDANIVFERIMKAFRGRFIKDLRVSKKGSMNS